MTTEKLFAVRFLADPAAVDVEAFARLWTSLNDPPAQAERFDLVKPLKRAYAADATASWELLNEDKMALTAGPGDLVTTMFRLRTLFSFSLWAKLSSWDERWTEWTRRLFVQVPFAYGYACWDGELAAHHLHDRLTKRGGAVYGHEGTAEEFPAFLPGLYWANFFGPELTAALPLAQLDGLPGVQRATLDTGKTLVTLEGPPFTDDLPARLALSRRAAALLGDDYFYDRDRPERTLRTVPTLEPLKQRLETAE